MSTNPFVIERRSGRAVPLRGDDIDTDRIIPARFLRCVTFEGLEKHVFEDDRIQLGGKHPFDDPRYRGAAVLVANRNFGCGSSREHAPQGLLRWGIQGLVGESFAEIFFGNCVALGVPCLTVAPEAARAIQDAVEADPRAEVTLDLRAPAVSLKTVAGAEQRFAASMPEGTRQRFLGGTWDATGILLSSLEQVRQVAAKLPYTHAFA
jgi:3-isopropylmalate/(R)-2-methylmalate dehydratase small subunit